MLQRSKGWMFGGFVFAILPLMACSHDEPSAAHHERPAHVEQIEGSDVRKVTLTERAVERTGVLTATVSRESENELSVVPYSSIIYDPQGNTWVYTSPAPRTFVRASITIDRIEGDNVYLTDGPSVGTAVASQGVAELYGTEFAVGH